MQKSATAAVELTILFMPPDLDEPIMTQFSKGVQDNRKCSHGGMCTPKRRQVVLGQEKGEGGTPRQCPFSAAI
jgi:hypothetical protein